MAPTSVTRHALYTNGLTASEILTIFRKADFAIEGAEIERIDLGTLPIHPDYATQSKDDLEAVRLTFSARNVP
jgi:hypothetical protein